MAKPIVVVGSYNVGLFIKGQRLPVKGETVIGETFYEGAGGKGSNQALCTAKMGGNVHFIGCVGNDKSARTPAKSTTKWASAASSSPSTKPSTPASASSSSTPKATT